MECRYGSSDGSEISIGISILDMCYRCGIWDIDMVIYQIDMVILGYLVTLPAGPTLMATSVPVGLCRANDTRPKLPPPRVERV